MGEDDSLEIFFQFKDFFRKRIQPFRRQLLARRKTIHCGGFGLQKVRHEQNYKAIAHGSICSKARGGMRVHAPRRREREVANCSRSNKFKPPVKISIIVPAYNEE